MSTTFITTVTLKRQLSTSLDTNLGINFALINVSDQ